MSSNQKKKPPAPRCLQPGCLLFTNIYHTAGTNQAAATTASHLLLDVGGLAVAQPQRLGGAPAGRAGCDR